ncbi:pentapeptide repeat-containing protein [Flindersiella endophytica]
MSDQTYSGMGFRELEPACEELVLSELDGCRFSKVSLAGTRLHRVIFSDCELVQCDLANVESHDSSFVRVRVTTSRLMGMNGVNTLCQDVTFEGCRATLAAFRFSRFKQVVFRDCDLREASFQESDLTGVRFEGCDLTGAQFSGARMAGTRLSDCVLAGVRGVDSFRGAIVAGNDLLGLTYSMAGALGITIDNGEE